MQLFAKLKKILRRGFRATLNFRKFKVALNLLRIIFLRLSYVNLLYYMQCSPYYYAFLFLLYAVLLSSYVLFMILYPVLICHYV